MERIRGGIERLREHYDDLGRVGPILVSLFLTVVAIVHVEFGDVYVEFGKDVLRHYGLSAEKPADCERVLTWLDGARQRQEEAFRTVNGIEWSPAGGADVQPAVESLRQIAAAERASDPPETAAAYSGRLSDSYDLFVSLLESRLASVTGVETVSPRIERDLAKLAKQGDALERECS